MKEQYRLTRIREFRLTHNGDMPPESCCASIGRCGSKRLGSEEDLEVIEAAAKVAKSSQKSEAKKK